MGKLNLYILIFVSLLLFAIGVEVVKIRSLNQDLQAANKEIQNREQVFKDLRSRLLKDSVEIKDNGDTFIVIQGSARIFYDNSGRKFEIAYPWSR